MDQILHQIGELVLGSVPTIVLFILLVIAYDILVRRPMDKMLAERRARTSGAMEQAKGALSRAEAETNTYEEKLRAARAELFHAREEKLKKWAAEREAAIAEVRHSTQERVRAAKHEIEQSAQEARGRIEGMSGELSTSILNAVLPKGIHPTEAAQ
jgi:F-type H+-transporting ATPase subunit b